MDDRTSKILAIRPEIPSARFDENTSDDERFQNETLRPVIKFQNHLFIEAFKNYIGKHKNAFFELSIERRLTYIEHAIQKDIKFRNSLKGMIIGQFSIEEYQTYIKNSSALNKRMMAMVIERLKDQVQAMEQPVLL